MTQAPSSFVMVPREVMERALEELMLSAENFFGAENPKRVGHIRAQLDRILAASVARDVLTFDQAWAARPWIDGVESDKDKARRWWNAALASAPAQGEVVAWRCRDKVFNSWELCDSPALIEARSKYPDNWEIVPLYPHPAQPVAVREARAYQALFEPEGSDAYDNLEGALIDIERLSAAGKPTDDVCIRTIKRVLDQLNAAYVALTVLPVGADQQRACIEGAVTAESTETKSAGGEA